MLRAGRLCSGSVIPHLTVVTPHHTTLHHIISHLRIMETDKAGPSHTSNGTPVKKLDQADKPWTIFKWCLFYLLNIRLRIIFCNEWYFKFCLHQGHQGQCEEAPGVFANFITLGSLLLVLVSLPLSLFFVVKVVQVRDQGTVMWESYSDNNSLLVLPWFFYSI